ncbi:MAG: histidine phosphatase family protein [Bacteroidota bacterium]|nr:histidine phosphatase family protein [Bacteroidota bacterium]
MVRHAIAEERGKKVFPNDDRPLTNTGIRKMNKNAHGMAKIIQAPTVIISSPLKRAYQTSEIVASKFHNIPSIVQSDDLLPETTVQKIIQLCKKYSPQKEIMIVGHEPILGKFLSTILHQKKQSMYFKKGAICGVDFFAARRQKSELLFFIPPKVLRSLSR